MFAALERLRPASTSTCDIRVHIENFTVGEPQPRLIITVICVSGALQQCLHCYTVMYFCRTILFFFIIDICTCFSTVFGNSVCFTRAAISAPGAWLSCLSRLDARVVSLIDVL